MDEATWSTRRVERRDWDAWQRLFKGYCAFYARPTSEQHLRKVWSWIHDEHRVEAIVAVPAHGSGQPVGLAHLRSWVRPLYGEVAGYLDDIFVDPEARGTGVAQTLFSAIDAMATEQGWNIVRWTTADDNYRARAAYDRVATRTGWITYEMQTGA
jgi:GNAT superfamily N-acetyltransferase